MNIRALSLIIAVVPALAALGASSIEAFVPADVLQTRPRQYFTATPLRDGRVLVAGGVESGRAAETAEIYDPESRSSAVIGPFPERMRHAAVQLDDGRVFFAGGTYIEENARGGPRELIVSSTDLYEPATNSFTPGPNMSMSGAVALSLLRDGNVLIVSSRGTGLFEPLTNRFRPLSRLVADMSDTGATTPPIAVGLFDGSVLVIFGRNAYLFDDRTEQFTSLGQTLDSRERASAVLLEDGRVLLAGGGSPLQATAETYDPRSRRFVRVDAPRFRYRHDSGALLPDGRAVFTSGRHTRLVGTITWREREIYSEVFDPVTSSFSPLQLVLGTNAVLVRTERNHVLLIGSHQEYESVVFEWSAAAGRLVPGPDLDRVREGAGAVQLLDGRVFVAGGSYTDPETSTELLDLVKGTSTPGGDLHFPRLGVAMMLLRDGRVLVTGGNRDAPPELYYPDAGVSEVLWGAPVFSTAKVLLNDGRVLFAGGSQCEGHVCTATRETHLFDPRTGTFERGPDQSRARTYDTATLLSNGTILLYGGYSPVNPGESEILDLDRNRSVPVAPSPHNRIGPGVFALEGGRALVVGGWYGGAFPSAIELYDPHSNTITVVGTLPHTREILQVAETRAGILVVREGTGFLLDPRTFRLRPVATVSVRGRAVSLADGTVLMLNVESQSPGTARFLLPPPTRRRIARGHSQPSAITYPGY